MVDFKVVELKTGDIYKVYAIDRQDDKTYFLLWRGTHFKWVDMRKVTLLDESLWG